jgi:NADH-quinone oxidoreductase subunit E
MLTPEERADLDEMRSHYPTVRAASVSVLKWLQKQRGYLSDESMRDAADYLGLPVAELDGLATFYNLLFRQPVGERVICLCDSISCWMCGSDRIRRHIEKRLRIRRGQTSADGRFTLVPVVCLGNCDRAPSMIVGDELYDDLTPEKVDEILGLADGANTGGADTGSQGGDHD